MMLMLPHISNILVKRQTKNVAEVCILFLSFMFKLRTYIVDFIHFMFSFVFLYINWIIFIIMVITSHKYCACVVEEQL